MSARVLAAVALGVAMGAAVGLGGFTFLYARGYSYLLDDPAACAICHVMQAYYDGWVHSSHRSVAVCNSCHLPESPVGRYATKAANGYAHAFAFTTGRFDEPLRIKARNREVTEAACRGCHAAIVSVIDHPANPRGALDCTRCHGDVGHPN